MGKETALAFVERLKNDSDFCRRIVNAPDNATRRQIAADAGFNFEAGDRAYIEDALGDLSEDELEGMAAGSSESFVADAGWVVPDAP